eukprot:scaffold75374_cov69-Phaeocystis_antarctica.AAC.1
MLSAAALKTWESCTSNGVEKPCVQRAAVDERLLVGESRATTLVSQMPPTSLAVSAEDAHGAPRADPSASVIQLLAARCEPADRFSSGVPALTPAPSSSNKSEQHIHINPATKSAVEGMCRCSPLGSAVGTQSFVHRDLPQNAKNELEWWGGNKRTASPCP